MARTKRTSGRRRPQADDSNPDPAQADNKQPPLKETREVVEQPAKVNEPVAQPKRGRGRPRKTPLPALPPLPTPAANHPSPQQHDNIVSFMNGAAVLDALTTALSPPRKTPDTEAVTPRSAISIMHGSGVTVRKYKVVEEELPSPQKGQGAEEEQLEAGGGVEEQQLLEGAEQDETEEPARKDAPGPVSAKPPAQGQPDPYDIDSSQSGKTKRRKNQAKAPYGTDARDARGSTAQHKTSAPGNSQPLRATIMNTHPTSMLPSFSALPQDGRRSMPTLFTSTSDADQPLPSVEGDTDTSFNVDFSHMNDTNDNELRQEPPPPVVDDEPTADDSALFHFQDVGEEKVVLDTDLGQKLLMSMSHKSWSGIRGRGLGGWSGKALKSLLSDLNTRWDSFCVETKMLSDTGEAYAKDAENRRANLRELTTLTSRIPSKTLHEPDAYRSFLEQNGQKLNDAISKVQLSLVTLEDMVRGKVRGFLTWPDVELSTYIVPFLAAALQYTYRSGETGSLDHEFDLYRAQVLQRIVGWLLRICALLEFIIPKKIAQCRAKGHMMEPKIAFLRDKGGRATVMKNLVTDLNTQMKTQILDIVERPKRERERRERQQLMAEYLRRKEEEEATKREEEAQRFASKLKQKVFRAQDRSLLTEAKKPSFDDWQNKMASRKPPQRKESLGLFHGGDNQDWEDPTVAEDVGYGRGKRRKTDGKPLLGEGHPDDWSDIIDEGSLPPLPGSGILPPRGPLPEREGLGHDDDQHSDGMFVVADSGDDEHIDIGDEDLTAEEWEMLSSYIRQREYGDYDIAFLVHKTQKSKRRVQEAIDTMVIGMRRICEEKGWKYPRWAKLEG